MTIMVGIMAPGRHACMALEQKLRPYILIHRCEEKRELTGNGVSV